jgi:hypothetical protein
MAEPPIVAVFDDRRATQECLGALREGGFGDTEVGFLGPAPTHGGGDDPDRTDESTLAGAAAGSVTGGVVGGMVGAVVAGLVPGVGPIVAGGLVAGVIAGAPAGAAIGGVAGTLHGAGVPVEQAGRYEEEVLAGRFLLIFRTARPGLAKKLVRLHGGQIEGPISRVVSRLTGTLGAAAPEHAVVGVFESAETAEAVADQLREAYPGRTVRVEGEPGLHLHLVEPERRTKRRFRVTVD